jgi:MFS family permease
MMPANSHALWTRGFVLLCLVQFLGYAQHAMLSPALPLYVTQLGGSPFVVGVVLSSFAASSVFIRPLIGHWSDRWSETGVMIFGLLFQGATIFVCLIPLPEAAMIANGLRGLGWAGLNTGGYSLLARTAPETRRGAASGYYSGAQSASNIFFPALALWLIGASWGGFGVMFTATALFSFAGAIAGWAVARETPRAISHSGPQDDTKWWRELFRFVEPKILLPSALLFWLNITWAAVINFIVLYARAIGIENLGLYFVVSGATSLLARPLLGGASDRIGRGVCVALGFALQAAALVLVIMVTSLAGIMTSGALYMLGNAVGSSAVLALAMERADPQRRGKAMATFSLAYPLGYGVGSLLIGAMVEAAGYVPMFLALAALQIAGLLFALARRRSLK